MYIANLTYFLFGFLLSFLSSTSPSSYLTNGICLNDFSAASLQLGPGLLLPRQTDLTIPGEVRSFLVESPRQLLINVFSPQCQPACQGFVGRYNVST